MTEGLLYIAVGTLTVVVAVLSWLLGIARRRVRELEFHLIRITALYGDRETGFKRRERI